jgi:hypothetical protein
MGASLRADFDEALRMVPLRGLSGDAKRAASMTFAPARLQHTQRIGSNLQPVNHEHGMAYCLLRYYGKRRQLGQPSSCRPAHNTAHQLAVQAFIDWRLMRGHTMPSMPCSEPATPSFFLSCTYQPSLPFLLFETSNEFWICAIRGDIC